MTGRLGDLARDAIYYFLVTVFVLGAAGAWSLNLLPQPTAQAGIGFLAVVYLVTLLLTVSHRFEAEHVRYLLEKVEEIHDELRDLAMKQGCR